MTPALPFGRIFSARRPGLEPGSIGPPLVLLLNGPGSPGRRL